jgi:NitT/TauT family transport system permease protein
MTGSFVRRVLGDYLIPSATLVGVLVVWEAVARVFRIPNFIMPAPSAILVEGWEWRYRFIGHTLVTLYETLGGFALSIAVGVPLAVLIVYSPAMRSAVYPLIVLAQSVPKIAVAPVLLLILGYGAIPKVVVAFLVAFFPSSSTPATGLAATPPELIDLSRSYRASAFKTFVKVRLPMALPFFFAGAKVAITLSVIGAVVAEFVGSDKGLGYVILSATSYWKTELAFSAMLILSLNGHRPLRRRVTRRAPPLPVARAARRGVKPCVRRPPRARRSASNPGARNDDRATSDRVAFIPRSCRPRPILRRLCFYSITKCASVV